MSYTHLLYRRHITKYITIVNVVGIPFNIHQEGTPNRYSRYIRVYIYIYIYIRSYYDSRYTSQYIPWVSSNSYSMYIRQYISGVTIAGTPVNIYHELHLTDIAGIYSAIYIRSYYSRYTSTLYIPWVTPNRYRRYIRKYSIYQRLL